MCFLITLSPAAHNTKTALSGRGNYQSKSGKTIDFLLCFKHVPFLHSHVPGLETFFASLEDYRSARFSILEQFHRKLIAIRRAHE